jgi:hypothetical protein
MLLASLKERKYICEFTMLLVCSQIILFKHLTDFHKVWYASYATIGHTHVTRFNFLQFITIWRIHELLR